MFSLLCRELKSEIRSPDDLIKKIRNSPVTPSPDVEELLYTWDWRSFVSPNLSQKMLQNHSFYHSFMIRCENGVSLLRAKKYPQMVEWIPEGGIILLRDKVEFSPVPVSEFRVESLQLDKVFSDLYTKYFPSLQLNERKESQQSWEKLRTCLENLPKKRENLPPMRLLSLPQQVSQAPPCPPHYLEPFLTNNTPELIGQHHLLEPSESEFASEIRKDTEVAIYTESKASRPWLGVVVNIQENKKRFEVLWYKRKGKSSVFHASKNKDGTDYTTILETETVMFWDFAESKGDQCFTVSKDWLEKIDQAYVSHDSCYV